MTNPAQISGAVSGEHMHYACMAAGCRLRDALDEIQRLQAVAVSHGACLCTWDVNENYRKPGDDEYAIVRAHPECPAHQQIGRAASDQQQRSSDE